MILTLNITGLVFHPNHFLHVLSVGIAEQNEN